MRAPPRFRQIVPGFERLPADHDLPRHAHFAAYVTVVLDGGYEQAAYAGRMTLRPGDVLVQPTLDRHESRMIGASVHLLRLAWPTETGLGGVYRPRGIDQVIRTARRDPLEAAALLAEQIAGPPEAAAQADWPDLLATALSGSEPPRIGAWAGAQGLARETVARGFARRFGVTPHRFAAELRARRAWMGVVSGEDSLAGLAAELGYADQPHMTREVRALTGATPNAWRQVTSVQDLAAGGAHKRA